MEPYLLTQGFVQKLVEHPLSDSPATPKIGGLYVDVDRTKALWDTVYRAPDSLKKEGDWVDRPSANIPNTYIWSGAVLAAALSTRGDARGATAIQDRIKQIAAEARINYPAN
jgi:hypothetical protein